MNILSVHLDLLNEEQKKCVVEKVHWIKLSEHFKISNNIGINHGGAIYGFVFNETQPSETSVPSDFEECIYIGKSGKRFYFDRKNGLNKPPKLCSYLYKRLIHHRDRFNGSASVSLDEKTKYGLYEQRYGLGIDVMNGTLTGIPLWVGLIPVPLQVEENFHENWLLRYERLEIFKYRKKFGKSPLMNLDEDHSNKQSESFSSNYELNDITSFMY